MGAVGNFRKNTFRLAGMLLLGASALPQSALGFELAGVRPATAQVEVDQPANFAIFLRPKEGMTVCGLNVEYGDGTDEYLVVRGPGTIQHAYRQSGTVVVKVEGKTRFKGLGTTFGCLGNAQTTSIQILPAGTAARREAEIANRRAAAERERDAQRQAIERAQAQTQAALEEAQRQRARADQATYNAQASQQAAQRAAAQAQVRTAPPPESQQKAVTEKPKAKTAMDL